MAENPFREDYVTRSHCSIVIRAFNEEEHIGKLMSGILAQTLEEVEIILVDSGSTDATIAIASRYPVEIVKIQPQEFSFGRALNLGIQHAQGKHVVIASAHVYPVYPDWLEKLLEPFQDPRIGLTYGRQRGNSTTRFSEGQVFARWFPDQSLFEQTIPFCNNANAAIRRDLWQTRPYDEDLPGLEDLEWASWAIDQGYQLAYVAEAEVVHVHDESPAQIYNRYRREAMALHRIRPWEQFHLLDFLRLLLWNVLSDVWHAAREGKLLAELSGILQFRILQFWGTYRGFRLSGPLTRALRETFYYPRRIRKETKLRPRGIEPIDYHVEPLRHLDTADREARGRTGEEQVKHEEMV